MKNTAAIFFDKRSIENQCVKALNRINICVHYSYKSKEFFRCLLDGALDLLVVDTNIQSEDIHMIQCYRLMNQDIHIIVLVDTEEKGRRLLAAGCNRYVYEHNMLDEIEALNTELFSERDSKLTATGGWRLSLIDFHLYTPNGNKIKITIREFKFLQLLFNSNNVVSKEIIRENVINSSYNGDQRIALLATRLRSKVNKITNEVLPIKSDYTHGYVFTASSYIEEKPNHTHLSNE